MQQGDSRPDRSTPQCWIFERHPIVLPIDRERQLTLDHIQVDSKDPLLLEGHTVFLSLGVASVAQLAHPVEPKAEVIVTKRVTNWELLLQCHTNFELVLSPGVRYDLPVMVPVHERSRTNDCPEQVVWLKQEGMSVVLAEMYFLRTVARVPAEFISLTCDHHWVQQLANFKVLLGRLQLFWLLLFQIVIGRLSWQFGVMRWFSTWGTAQMVRWLRPSPWLGPSIWFITFSRLELCFHTNHHGYPMLHSVKQRFSLQLRLLGLFTFPLFQHFLKRSENVSFSPFPEHKWKLGNFLTFLWTTEVLKIVDCKLNTRLLWVHKLSTAEFIAANTLPAHRLMMVDLSVQEASRACLALYHIVKKHPCHDGGRTTETIGELALLAEVQGMGLQTKGAVEDATGSFTALQGLVNDFYKVEIIKVILL